MTDSTASPERYAQAADQIGIMMWRRYEPMIGRPLPGTVNESPNRVTGAGLAQHVKENYVPPERMPGWPMYREAVDYFRIARVYREAGEWPKAKEYFDRYVKQNPKDDKGLAEVGAYYLMNGDRETAEQLFERSFKLESEMWSTESAAAGYLGVDPQE